MQSISWQSESGAALSFGIYNYQNYQGAWNPVRGIYMFCRQEPNGAYTPLYIGQAQSLKDRLAQHEQWSPAAQRGASIVLAAVVPSPMSLDSLEQELIRKYQPALNLHHR